MPIRINLKEIFSSDPQEILVDKLNFNYNKLLELGVGTPGPTGLTGPQGPAGPVGLVGPQGDRGATWWVDSGDPNTLTFTGLIDGDLYLDQTSNVFQVWKYDDMTNTWVTVVSIAAIVTSYLSSISNIPFETVTTFQAPGSTAVNKFILFDKRDDYVADATRGTANVSLNNMLFLNNFDEADITYPVLGQDQYNSLLAIFPAHDDTQDSGRAQSGRYHIEMGSLYMDNDILPVGTIKYSDLKHNLKAKFYKQYVDPILPPQLPATNTWINTARFSLSYTESQSLLDIDQNAAFEFLFPKWNNEGMSPVREELSVVLSSAEAIVERSAAHTHIVADGIHVSTTGSSINATLGLALDYSSLNAKLSGKNHLMLDSNSGVDGVILLNKGAFINGDANIVDGLAIGSGYEDLTAPANSLIVEGRIGLGTSSPGSGFKQHNYLTGTVSSRTITYNDVQSLVITPSFPPFPGQLTSTRTVINNLSGSTVSPIVYINSASFSGTNSLNGILLNSLTLVGNTTLTGNIYGTQIELNSASSIDHGGNFYGSSLRLTNVSDFTGANPSIFGNYFRFSPKLDSTTGGTIRGNQIELDNYTPNATTEIRGSDLIIRQTSNLPQGAIYGNTIRFNVNSTSSAASVLTGINMSINTDGPNYDLPNTSHAINITSAGDIPASGSTYGLKYLNSGGFGDASSKAYGFYLEGTNANYAEGDTRFNGSVSINDNSSYTQYIRNVWSGVLTYGWNATSGSSTYFAAQSANDYYPLFIDPRYNDGSGSGDNLYVYLDYPTIDPNRTTIHITMRYIGGGAEESLYVIPTPSVGTNSATIYFRRAKNVAGDWDYDARIRFMFTITEYA